MSKQLSISAGFCVLAMGAFALFAAPLLQADHSLPANTEALASAPAGMAVSLSLPLLAD